MFQINRSMSEVKSETSFSRFSFLSSEGAGVAVLRDLRDKLKELNRHMREPAELLRSVRRNTA